MGGDLTTNSSLLDHASLSSIHNAETTNNKMSQAQPQGSSLQTYNSELVKCIEELREKREELNKLIYKEEEDKAKIQKELSVLQERLKKVSGKNI